MSEAVSRILRHPISLRSIAIGLKSYNKCQSICHSQFVNFLMVSVLLLKHMVEKSLTFSFKAIFFIKCHHRDGSALLKTSLWYT